MREKRVKELRLGKREDKKMDTQINIKNHSTPDNLFAWQIAASSPHTREYNISMVSPPFITINVHVAPDKYIDGKIAKNFPSFGPKKKKTKNNTY